MARIKFYSEYGSYQKDIQRCKEILSNEKDVSPDVLNRLANRLTPKLTLITNVEYQTMRKMSKSFPLIPLKDNSIYGVARRVYDYIDNRVLIADYLTHSTLRLVQPEGEVNRTQRDYVGFWFFLRKTRMIDQVLQLTMQQALNDFLIYKSATCVDKTIEYYRSNIGAF